MNSAECCEFDKKNPTIQIGGYHTDSRTCSDCPLLLQGLSLKGAIKYEYCYSSSTIVERRSPSDKYVQRFAFAGRFEWTLSKRSILSAECCEFDEQNLPIASENIKRGRTCSECLLLQSLIVGGALRYEYYYSSSSTVLQRCSTSNMYKAKSIPITSAPDERA